MTDNRTSKTMLVRSIDDMTRFVIVELPEPATPEQRKQIAERIAAALENPTPEPPAAPMKMHVDYEWQKQRLESGGPAEECAAGGPSKPVTTGCIWEDCDQEAIYCAGHAREFAAPTPPPISPLIKEASILLTRYRDSLTECQCEPRPQCSRMPRQCDGTDCAATCDCRECNYCRTVALLAVLRTGQPPEVCQYTLTEGSGRRFETTCGHEFWLDDERDLYDFCPFCGKSVEECHSETKEGSQT